MVGYLKGNDPIGDTSIFFDFHDFWEVFPYTPGSTNIAGTLEDGPGLSRWYFLLKIKGILATPPKLPPQE